MGDVTNEQVGRDVAAECVEADETDWLGRRDLLSLRIKRVQG